MLQNYDQINGSHDLKPLLYSFYVTTNKNIRIKIPPLRSKSTLFVSKHDKGLTAQKIEILEYTKFKIIVRTILEYGTCTSM